MDTEKPPNHQEAMRFPDPELLEKLKKYFHLLDNPNDGLSTEEAQVMAGEYFGQEIAGRYSDMQINAGIWMSR